MKRLAVIHWHCNVAGYRYGSEKARRSLQISLRDLAEIFRKPREEPPLRLHIVGISSYSQSTGIFPKAVSRREESRLEEKKYLLCSLAAVLLSIW